MFKYITSIILVGTVFLPLAASAHDAGGDFWSKPGFWGPIVSCYGSPTNTDGSQNPNACRSLCDLAHTIQHFIWFIMTLAVFVFAPIMMIWGGLMILLAGASPSNLQLGKNIIGSAVIGVVIALGAGMMVNVVMKVLAQAGGNASLETSWSTISCKNLPPTGL